MSGRTTFKAVICKSKEADSLKKTYCTLREVSAAIKLMPKRKNTFVETQPFSGKTCKYVVGKYCLDILGIKHAKKKIPSK